MALSTIYYAHGKIPLIEYGIDFWPYYNSFVLNELVNDLSIINQCATANITVNNVLLIPGQAFDAGGNYGEIIKQTFTVTVAPGSSGAIQILALLKRYKDVELKHRP
jgi:hypothetical protein